MKIPGIVLILLLHSFFTTAQVQRKSSPTKQTDSLIKNPAENKMDRSAKRDLLKELDLSREQKLKLKEVRRLNMAKKEAIENNNQLDDKEKKSQIRDLQKEQAQSIQALLTDEQKAKFKNSRQAQNKKLQIQLENE